MPDGTVIPKNGTETFGFWLPHGLEGTDNVRFAAQVHQCKERFNKIEEAFREVEGVPREKLWLESEQAEVFEQHPELLPGDENDTLPPQTRSSSIVLTGMDVSGL
ncbi:uncharacterized protein ASPGLDRAFT_58090 [Aspergillus glaucus CBS 516.65]|uniref:Uncharacterized protein n=1 Tax=Aspergillus glaucus CBS 516.65 TaxID=1160497 RepID=A0A1L9VKE6_ASPGL|nr:hypothetical protein ASPGLDRAFT_58090 [Aspergillus glaucus CBS 516.65]OJJ84396.1 hypothetical protein ASPGLDRAFT_58090 [Aspergillus glaucus CBS 516.65]